MSPAARPLGVSLALAAAIAATTGCPDREAPASSSSDPGPAGAAGEAATLPVELRAEALADVVRDAQRDPRRGIFVPPSAKEMEVMEGLTASLGAAARDSGRTAAAGPTEGPGPGADGPPPRGSLAPPAAAPAGLPPAFGPVERWAVGAASVGFELFALESAASRLVVLREAQDARRGGGIYALRAVIRGRPLVLQAPHAFHDVGTGDLAREAFEATGAAALTLNTVHRHLGAREGAPSSGSPADVAHVPMSHFQGATRGLARALPRAVFCQIHGYSAARHPELSGIDLVASRGEASAVADPAFDRLVDRLERLAGKGRVAVYGRDPRADRLGATRNVQGRFLNAYSDDAFYHLELSAGLRERLGQEPALRAEFIAALGALVEEAP